MRQKIVIYRDDGVGEFGVFCLTRFFERDEVRMITAQDVINGDVLRDADMFVMPGGADLPYCRKLNGAGNKNIRAFVEQGGAYIGLCAGAYYACAAIEYHKGLSDEICEPRELAFVPGIAVGSLHGLARPYDQTLDSAAIATLRAADGIEAQAFYHGGCRFDLQDPHNVEVLASYRDLPNMPPVIVRTKVGKGQAVLSGVHFEITPALLARYPAEGKEERKSLLISAFTNPWSAPVFHGKAAA